MAVSIALEADSMAAFLAALSHARDEEAVAFARASVRLPLTLTGWRSVGSALQVVLADREHIGDRYVAELLAALSSVPLSSARRSLSTMCLAELHRADEPKSAVTAEDGWDEWAWKEPRRLCAARLLSLSQTPAPKSMIRELHDAEADVTVRFWLAFALGRSGDARQLMEALVGLTLADLKLTDGEGCEDPRHANLREAARRLPAGVLQELDQSAPPSRLRDAILAAARAAPELPLTAQDEQADSVQEEPVMDVLTSEQADAVGRAWLTQSPWLDQHDPPPAEWPNTVWLSRMNPRLAGLVATHILRERIGYRHPEFEFLLDGGMLSAMPIWSLGRFEPDFPGLLEVFLHEEADRAVQLQAAAAAAYSDDLAALMREVSRVVQEPSSRRRRLAAEFVEYYLRYNRVGAAIPTWGGGGDPDDVPLTSPSHQEQENQTARFFAAAEGPEVAPVDTWFDVAITLTLDDEGGVVVRDLAPDWDELRVNVLLCVSGGLAEKAEIELVIGRASRRGSCTFKLFVASGVLPEAVAVRALFMHEGRFCGSLGYRLEASQPVAATGQVLVDSEARSPDLCIAVARTGESSLAWHFVLGPQIRTAIGQHSLRLHGTSRLDEGAVVIFDAAFQEFIDAGSEEWPEVALAIGDRIAKLAPPELTAALSAVLGARANPAIQLLVDRSDVPWELMTIRDRDGVRVPMHVLCDVARWSVEHEGALASSINGDTFLTMAPSYPEPRELPEAQEESSHLQGLGAEMILPATKQNFLACVRRLATTGGGILHFAGHGQCIKQAPFCSAIDLDDGVVTALAFEAAAEGKLERTLIVLSACEVGDGRRAIRVFGGWEESIQRSGCSAFVAPLWQTVDSHSREFVVDVVRSTLEGLPIAGAMRRSRAKRWRERDSVLAYCFYGDATATVVSGRALW
ncbi:MAG: CHAT domain-containing protein [Polyangiaceae bacterium]|nr:CHAT domain-containing protein [Polyangiaceae bacterium]